MLTRLAISDYRSLRNIRIALGPVTVVTGGNGTGKSSLYRALRLLADAAQGDLARSIAEEGGMRSALWADGIFRTRHDPPVSMRLGFGGTEYGYAIDIGKPLADKGSAFELDPAIKAEAMWTGEILRRDTVFATRQNGLVRVRGGDGAWERVETSLTPEASMMLHCADAGDAIDLLRLREHMRRWRFYDNLRTDREAPARRPQVGTRTDALANDGRDLASVLQTMREEGAARELRDAIEDAFPGTEVGVEARDGMLAVTWRQAGIERPFGPAELSDGTLRYLLLGAALLPTRPAPLIVLNEPEASLHPDLAPAVARMILTAARRTQVVVVTHSERLAAALSSADGCVHVELTKEAGVTAASGDRPPWRWPER